MLGKASKAEGRTRLAALRLVAPRRTGFSRLPRGLCCLLLVLGTSGGTIVTSSPAQAGTLGPYTATWQNAYAPLGLKVRSFPGGQWIASLSHGADFHSTYQCQADYSVYGSTTWDYGRTADGIWGYVSDYYMNSPIPVNAQLGWQYDHWCEG